MLPKQPMNKLFRPILLALIVLTVGLAACSPTNLPDAGNATLPADIPPQAVLEAVNQLSEELGVSVQDIEIREFEQVEWPNACLGIPQEGQACAEVITPGFRVALEVNGEAYEVRSNLDGTVIVRTPEGAG